jgi:hypothetical protein
MQSSRGDTSDGPVLRRDQNARISFYDPANQGTLDRLITGGGGTQSDGEGEDENALATMSNVEEMIEGYEWASDNIIERKSTRGTADLIEARLLDELMALDKVSDYYLHQCNVSHLRVLIGQHSFLPRVRRQNWSCLEIHGRGYCGIGQHGQLGFFL